MIISTSMGYGKGTRIHMTTRSWGKRNRRGNEGTVRSDTAAQTKFTVLYSGGKDGQESFLHRAAVFFGPFPGSQLGCEALHTLQFFFVINLERIPHAAAVLQDRQNQGLVQV